MTLLRSIAQVVLILVLVAIGTNVCVDRCSQGVDADETAGMAIQQKLEVGK
jgi:hypothetical protein